MNPKLCRRLLGSQGTQVRTIPSASDEETGFAKTSVRDQAALLLSIADIAKSELGSSGLTDLWEDNEDFPKFPLLWGGPDVSAKLLLAPRTEAPLLTDILSKAPATALYPSNRVRTVSIDSPYETTSTLLYSRSRTPSPVSLAAEVVTPVTPMQSPRLPVRKQRSLRLSARAKQRNEQAQSLQTIQTDVRAVSSADQKNRPLQGVCPQGVPTKKILRRKFSWKNYPELEQFLIANREEYLRHSALNYTVQQKQYNNRLTDRLLELSTEHGYVFEEKEFSFVTVRDRIRCYYKSYVQSAKKRGILMGYAARKAGLLSEQDIEKSFGKAGQIVIP